jgi:hypothetical protein
VKTVLLALLVLLAAGTLWLYAAGSGWLGDAEAPGEVHAEARPADVQAAYGTRQSRATALLGGAPGKQILFGDFHVHTTFSFDAFMMNLPIAGGPGTHPPADACDFARFCSALDFWSINDHAENLTQDLWQKSVDSVRQCNAAAGDPANPDLVTYLGWEWSHIGDRPENHYGHKNVVLLGTDDDEIPARPIASRGPATAGRAGLPLTSRVALAVAGGERGRDFTRLLRDMTNTPRCPDDVPVRELPADCLESAPTPEVLFEKLDDWGLPSIVIPHGTAWGIYTPAGSDWRKQLPGNDPARQTLVEVYSGHGNSEQLPDWREVDVAADGSLSCPEPRAGYLPSCWRAGELIEARCLEVGEGDAECARRAAAARANYVAAYQAGWKTLPGYEASDWRDAGQAPDMFQPAFNYRPRGSVQYMLALRDFSDPANPKRFDFGFIGSSDNHSARPGTGYKEFARGEMTDGRGRRGEPGDGDRARLRLLRDRRARGGAQRRPRSPGDLGRPTAQGGLRDQRPPHTPVVRAGGWRADAPDGLDHEPQRGAALPGARPGLLRAAARLPGSRGRGPGRGARRPHLSRRVLPPGRAAPPHHAHRGGAHPPPGQRRGAPG